MTGSFWRFLRLREMNNIIKICMGSACHAKGAFSLIQIFEDEIKKQNAENKLQLRGRFCKNQCKHGVNVEVGDILFQEVTPEDVPKIVQKALEVLL